MFRYSGFRRLTCECVLEDGSEARHLLGGGVLVGELLSGDGPFTFRPGHPFAAFFR